LSVRPRVVADLREADLDRVVRLDERVFDGGAGEGPGDADPGAGPTVCEVEDAASRLCLHAVALGDDPALLDGSVDDFVRPPRVLDHLSTQLAWVERGIRHAISRWPLLFDQRLE
jgi:hypothetical protein